MISVNIVLDTRYKKKGNLYPLKLRVIHNRKPLDIALGYSLQIKDWDEKGQKVKVTSKSVENVTRLNSLLNKEKQKVLDVLVRLQDEGVLDTLSPRDLKNIVSNKSAETMVVVYGKDIVEELKSAKRFGNARVYDTMIRSVQDFLRGRDIPMRQITYTWLKKYEAWYLAKGNSVNGLSVSMRTLRALFNRAIKEKVISRDYYPFADYSIKTDSTRKRAISMDDLKKIRLFEPRTQRQEWAKDYFMLSFYLMGASFVDIAYLQVKNITSGRIEYKRRKTGRLHSIPISPPLQELLNKYMPGKGREDFILNVIKSQEPARQLVNVRDALRRFNRSLKEIGEVCGIEATLTSYVARHSYATIAKYKVVPTAVISEALGHKSEEVTQVYLDSFDKEVMDKYHNIIIE